MGGGVEKKKQINQNKTKFLNCKTKFICPRKERD